MAPADAGFSPHHTAGVQPHYWSHRALQEDKKKCLTDLPHTNHQVSNTLEFLHEDKKHHSCAAVAEKKKLHQPIRDQNWRRRPSTPTHPYANKLSDQKKFWSHYDLVEAKRKLTTTLQRPGATSPRLSEQSPMSARESLRDPYLYDTENTMPQSARRPGSFTGSIAGSAISRSQSVDGRMQNTLESGTRSPTMKELIQHDGMGLRDHPHNELATNWWKVCREERDTNTPHRSHEKFCIKKQHHGVPIHEVPATNTSRSHYADSFAHGVGLEEIPPESSNRMLLYHRDPKGSAVQGEYPHCRTNEAWAAPRGDETPPSRYHSCELLALDKRRHAAPVDGGWRWQKMRVKTNLDPSIHNGSPGEQSETGKGSLYRSNFTMQQHKKKHLAGLDRTVHVPPTPPGNTPRQFAGSGGGGGWSSHREMEYAKKFHNVGLNPPQTLHREACEDRPWPKPGAMLKDDVSEISGATPPYPSGPIREIPLNSSHRAHTAQAVTVYGKKSGARSEADSAISDPDLLHSSQQELALRKQSCSTNMRTSSRKGDSTARSMFDRVSASGSDLNEAPKSHEKLTHQKITHRFAHDDPRRKRTDPLSSARQVPGAPQPRSGQWTPAHI